MNKQGGIEKWKLAGMEKYIFGGDCRGCSSRVVTIKELLSFCREWSTLYIEDWIVAYHVV